MAKFQLGQTVKYIGRNGLFSPLKGDVGVVLKKNLGYRVSGVFLVGGIS